MLKHIGSGEHLRAYRIPHDGAFETLPDKQIVGSKAHFLMRMASRGLPVPPGFALPTDLCRTFMENGPAALKGIEQILVCELEVLGSRLGRGFGDPRRPLLVSVRSGAPVSMPGMMETVLNVGLNAETASGLLRTTGNPRLVHDCRCRLVSQYGEVVHGIAATRFTGRQEALLSELGVSTYANLDTDGVQALAEAFEDVFEAETGAPFPIDPYVQLRAAIEAVLSSWSSERAQSYRNLNAISDKLGTAVLVQAMAFGNLGPNSGAGVGFTRNPSDGTPGLYGDFVSNAQGEDVVSGRRRAEDLTVLESRAPEAYRTLVTACSELEREFGDMQDFEFTVEDGSLLLLQCRPGKRTPRAAMRIACDLVAEGLLDKAQALRLLDGIDFDSVVEERLALRVGAAAIARGTPAGSGVAVGVAVFDPKRVTEVQRRGARAILICKTAETADIAAINEAAALVTAQGARTSHAAVVARQLNKPCIVGVGPVDLDATLRAASFGAIRVAEGDPLSVDGSTGTIYAGEFEIQTSKAEPLIRELRAWQAEQGLTPRLSRATKGRRVTRAQS